MVTHKYTVLCDQIRIENTGKFILVGVYTPDVTVPTIPFGLATLAFLNCFETDEAGTWDISFQLSHHGTTLAGGSGKVAVQRSGFVALPINLGAVHLPGDGPYTFNLQIAGQVPAQFSFNVVLNPMPAQIGPAPSGVH